MLADRAGQFAHETGSRITSLTIVDSLAQFASELPYAGKRLAAEDKAAALLALAR